MWPRICATWAEKPHWGKSFVPFMNTTTSLAATVLRIQSWTACSLMSVPFGLSDGVSRRPRDRAAA